MSDTSLRAARGHTLAGTWNLVRLMLRRDRIKLPSWVLGGALFWAYYSQLPQQAYPNAADLQSIAGMASAPSGRMWFGPTYFLENVTHATFIPAAYGLYMLLFAGLMSILLIIRHTRVEEQTGRAELVRASAVGRHAPLTAALLVAVIANGAMAVLIALMMIADPIFASEGSLLFATGCFMAGLSFAGMTALVVQMTEYSRTATSLAAGAGLGIAFMLRAMGDMADAHGSLLSWLSPLAWPQQTAPFVLDRWWPLLISVAFTVVAAAGGYLLSTRRDVGAGLLAVKAGKARAAGWLGSPLGLVWRLERRSITWWTIGMFVAGISMGAFADASADMPEIILDAMGGAENIVAGYLSYMGVFMATIVAIYAVLAMQGLRSEEAGGRGEPVLASNVSRWAWLGSALVVGTVGVILTMAATGVGMGLGAASAGGDSGLLWEVTAAYLNHIPSILVVLGAAALLFGLAPRWQGLAWAVVGYGFIVGTFGPVLKFPDWLFDLSPFEHAARMPTESFETLPVVVLALIAAALAAIGLVAFRRRDIQST
jgi:ABC-2 type transport system permease protein